MRVCGFLLSWLTLATWALAAPPTDAAREPLKLGQSAHEPAAGEASPGALWEIEFEDDLQTEDYANRVDFFQIEIAAVSKDGKIEYISKVRQRKPDKRVGHLDGENRLRIGWKKGTLAEADRALLKKAGINPRGKELWHFFSAKTQAELAKLERSYAGRQPSDIRRTRFRLQETRAGADFEFVVVEQEARRGAPIGARPTSRNAPNPQ